MPLQAEERNMGVGPLFISRVIAFLVIVLFLSARTPAQTFTTLRGALEEVAAKYQIQVGLEYAINDKDLQPITLNLSAKSVDTVLTRLISQKTDLRVVIRRQRVRCLSEVKFRQYSGREDTRVYDQETLVQKCSRFGWANSRNKGMAHYSLSIKAGLSRRKSGR